MITQGGLAVNLRVSCSCTLLPSPVYPGLMKHDDDPHQMIASSHTLQDCEERRTRLFISYPICDIPYSNTK